MAHKKRAEAEFVIENVGPIDGLRLQLRPGVAVFRGPNAAGKTTAITALEKAAGAHVDVEPRDGTSRGIITGPGVRLVITRVTKRTGEAELALADTSPFDLFVKGGGFKDTKARARARLRALTELFNLNVGEPEIATLCGDDEIAVEWLRLAVRSGEIESLDVAERKLRDHLHARARDQEEAAAEAEGRRDAARERRDRAGDSLGGRAHLIDLSPAEAQEQLLEGTRRHERAQARCEAREELEREQAAIRQSLGERPDIEPEQARLADLRSDRAAAEAEVRRLELALAEARSSVERLADSVAAQEQHVDMVERAAADWDAQQETLARVIDNAPSREELRLIYQDEITARQVILDRAQESARYRDAEAERAGADHDREHATRAAVELRDAAADLPSRLGSILAEAGAEGLTVIDGRIHVIRNGKPLDFEARLSEGERTRYGLDLAAKAYTGVDAAGEVYTHLITLGGSYWASLDPRNRAEFAREAAERDLFFVTEEPTGGELRVEYDQ